jgi:hypothetical protein
MTNLTPRIKSANRPGRSSRKEQNESRNWQSLDPAVVEVAPNLGKTIEASL